MTSDYMPDVMVEVAWNAGFTTPSAERAWTDVSEKVELKANLVVNFGRSDQRSDADANQLRLTLDNSDGRFTAGNTASPYYPNVKLDRPIRVTAVPVDGPEQVLFLGYVNEWPVEFNGTDAYASATISASSRLSRLGMVQALRSVIETEILADSPVAYYPLGEPEGSTSAADMSGNAALPLTQVGDGADVIFGQATGPGTDGLTAATFGAGRYLQRTLQNPAIEAAECFVLRDGLPALTEDFLTFTDATGALASFGISPTGELSVNNGAALVAGSNIADGHTHHFAVADIDDGTTWTVYIDGVSHSVPSPGAISTPVQVAAGASLLGDVLVTGLTGVLAHLALYSTPPSAARFQAHVQGGFTGFAGDTTDERLIRYAGYAGIPADEVAAEPGTTTMQHLDTTDKPPVEMMRTCETTEGGVLFDALDGTLTLHNRAHRYTAEPVISLSMTDQQVEADYAPIMDRTGLLNDVSAVDSSGTRRGRAKDDTSRDDYGIATGSVETASEDHDEPLNYASWLVYQGKDPKTRVPTLSVDALAQAQPDQSPTCAEVLAVTLGDKVRVTSQPSQLATSESDFFVEGGTVTIGPESVRVTWNVSASAPWDQVLIVGDPVRGVVGEYAVAF